MIRLTKRISDGTYRANDDGNIPGENSYTYKNLIIERCGIMESKIELMNDSR